MNFIGNFAHLIKDEWLEEIQTKTGRARPKDWPPMFRHESVEYAKVEEAGYDINSVYWYIFDPEDLSFRVSFPFLKNDFHFWISKLLPGNLMPMHSDPYTLERDGLRYWIPLQDYHSGHVFIINDEMVTNYKKGDVFIFNESTDVHGAANIGHIPRYSLLITEYV